jgi:hypothetical protein
MREKRALEDPFREAHRLARPEFQKLSSTRRKIDLWASKLVKLFRDQERIAYEAVAPLWKRLIGTDLLIEAYRDLMVHVPQWPLYLAGWAHAMPNRAIRERNYGAANHLGATEPSQFPVSGLLATPRRRPLIRRTPSLPQKSIAFLRWRRSSWRKVEGLHEQSLFG